MSALARLLAGAWDIIRQPNKDNSQVALIIAAIAIATVVGGVVAALYGFSVRQCGFGCRTAGAFLALLSAAAAFAAGGLFGLLFGAPSWNGNAPAAGGGDAGGSATDSARQPSIRPNTSLEEIARWLTTMIVGLSLVNLGKISAEATQLGIWLTQAVALDAHSTNATPGIVLVLPFGFAGFLLIYLWSLRFLPSELRESYLELQNEVRAAKAKSERLETKLKELPLAVPVHALERQMAAMKDAGVDAATVDEIRKRYDAASKWDDEPLQGFGPAQAAGYTLSAEVTKAADNVYSIKVSLKSGDAQESGKMFWLLHHSFLPEVVSACPLEAGLALYANTVSEAFWIGVVIPKAGGEAVRLALDLGTAAGATDAFRGIEPSTER